MFPFLDLTDHDTGNPLMLRLEKVESMRQHEEGGTHVIMDSAREYWANESIDDCRATIANFSVRLHNLGQRAAAANGR